MDLGRRVPISDPGIPSDPGVYLVFCDVALGPLDWDPASGPAYSGEAESGLRARISMTHLGDTGRSTLRRTYGALLNLELGSTAVPRPRRGPHREIDFTNYTFTEPGDTTLTDWMVQHLTVAIVRSHNPADRRKALVAEFTPPLNLTGWPNPWRPEIKRLRKICANEARSHGGG